MPLIFLVLASLTIGTGMAASPENSSGDAEKDHQLVHQIVKRENGKQIDVRFTTTEEFSSMCFLRVANLSIKTVPHVLEVFDPSASSGTIAIRVKLDRRAPCLSSPGPNLGVLSLSRGRRLNGLSVGSYEFKINGQHLGKLILTEDDAFWQK